MLTKGLTSKETQRSLSVECKALRGLVAKLRQDMVLCKDETQKVKDQLQCLIYLVRRAWAGDGIASIHVANIVGVAPPSIQKKKQENIEDFPTLGPVNNWARLCIGLLNKMYHEEELELRAAQLTYLQNREGYLNDELASHSDVMRYQSNMSVLKTNTFQLLQAKAEEEEKERQEQLDQLAKQKYDLQLQYHKQHPSHIHHYRKTSRDSVQQTKELNSEDALFVRPASISRPTSGAKLKQHFTTQHVRSNTSDGLMNKSRGTNQADESSITLNGTRPVSAYSANRSKNSKQSTTYNRGLTQSAKTRKQLDLIEKDLKLTTKTLQDRLGISKQGMV